MREHDPAMAKMKQLTLKAILLQTGAASPCQHLSLCYASIAFYVTFAKTGD